MSIIKIKRSQVTATPSSLQEAELAYSYNSQTLFIGGAGGTNVLAIGGKADRDKLATIASGAQVNTVASVAGKQGAVTLVKADLTNFTESEYVHTSGAETISGNKTFANDVVVTGNLTINGTTTTVNAATLSIADNIITLNSDVTSGAPTQDSGVEVLRGSSTTAQLLWNETTDKWQAGLVGSLADISLVGHTHTLATGATDVTITAVNLNALDDGVDTALHFHTADRARANHTGTQLASTISDFTTAADARIGAASINALADVIITTPSTSQVIQYNGTNWVNATSAAGVTTFLALTDTPAAFTGLDGSFVKVNAGATALEFVADPGYLTAASVVDGGAF
jgi:hypothetical protein